jgi:hypothetical protein
MEARLAVPWPCRVQHCLHSKPVTSCRLERTRTRQQTGPLPGQTVTSRCHGLL